MRKTPAVALFAPALFALAACAPSPSAEDAAPPAATTAKAAADGPVLPWVSDDYSAALAEARQRDLPIFVESWAPW